jgi:haloacid dehalogenase-like hydrolase
MIRILAVDVDGTLLDSSHALRADVRDALGLLSLSGVTVVLATARGPMALSEIVHKNDVEMLKEVGLGIAMGNACDDAKAAAGWVTGNKRRRGCCASGQKIDGDWHGMSACRTAAASKLGLSARASLFRKVVAELIESLEENRRSR